LGDRKGHRNLCQSSRKTLFWNKWGKRTEGNQWTWVHLESSPSNGDDGGGSGGRDDVKLCPHRYNIKYSLDTLLASQTAANGVVTIVCRIEIRKMAEC